MDVKVGTPTVVAFLLTDVIDVTRTPEPSVWVLRHHLSDVAIGELRASVSCLIGMTRM